MILIRRLALDDLSEGTSVHALIDLIGRRLVELRPVRLRPGDPERPDAEAVVFAGRIEALAALAAQLARHGAGRAWYWRRLPPPLAPSMRLAEITSRLLAEAAAPPHGITGASAFAQLLLEARVLDAFIAALPTGAVASFDEVRRARHPPPVEPASPAELPDDRMTGQPESGVVADARAETWWRALLEAWQTVLGRQARTLPENDERLAWLAVTALVASFGPGAAAKTAPLARYLVRLARHAGARRLPIDRSPVLTPVRAAGLAVGLSQAAESRIRSLAAAGAGASTGQRDPRIGPGCRAGLALGRALAAAVGAG